MAANLFENAGLDPSVLVGAIVVGRNENFRVGKSKHFIIEADEFNDNYLNYRPEVIILNNIELDHPDFFKSEKQLFNSFKKFIKRLRGEKVLVVNQDSPGVRTLFRKYPNLLSGKLKMYGYTLDRNPIMKVKNSFYGEVVKMNSRLTSFRVMTGKAKEGYNYRLSLPGIHNVSNALAVVVLGHVFKIMPRTVNYSFANYKGIKRRLEHLGTKREVCVYDDYAHHPTAVGVTLSALKQKYPSRTIWAIVEPHSYSRTKALLEDYRGVFEDADKVIIGPIFKARDKKTYGVSGQSIVDISEHRDIIYQDNLERIIKTVEKGLNKGDVVLVMGAGKSYLWARKILASI
jgi:UDP-N-acetylmuramate--alanine ligase